MAGLEARRLFSAAPIDPAMVSDVDLPAESEASGFETEQPSTVTFDSQSSRDLVILDSGVPHLEELLEDLRDSRDDVDVFVLDADHDGVDQITQILESRTEINSVHIVSHGEGGAVKLGNVWLSGSNLDGYAAQIASWQSSLTSTADLLFSGCDLADTPSGRTFVESIGELSGADVAASSDDTGHADFGGDWDLEFSTGEVESDVPFSAALQESWSGKLATITVTTFADIVDAGDGVTSLREAITAANAGGGGDTIDLSTIGAGTFVVSSQDLDITHDMTIVGIDPTSTVIDGTGSTRVFSNTTARRR